MNKFKRTASIAIVAAMTFTTAITAFAAPTHIIAGKKAYTVKDALDKGYRTTIQNEVAKEKGLVYIVDKNDKGVEKYIKLSDISEKDYKGSVAKASNRKDELSDIKLVDKNGNETEFIPGEEVPPEPVEVDKTELDRVNKEVEDLKEPDYYTEESWAELQNALNLSEETQEEVDAKVDAIREAIDGLVVNEDEGIFKLEVNFNELSNGTIANVIIEQEYINRIEKVIIEGMEAKQNPNKPELWRVVFDGNKEITKDDVTVVFKEEKPVEIINKEETFAKNGIFGDTAVKVTIKDDFDIESVKVNNMNLPKLNDNTYYNRAFDYLEIGTELIVVVTTTDGTKDQLVLTVVK